MCGGNGLGSRYGDSKRIITCAVPVILFTPNDSGLYFSKKKMVQVLDSLSSFAVQHCIPPYICQTSVLLLAFCWRAEGRGAENLVRELL